MVATLAESRRQRLLHGRVSSFGESCIDRVSLRQLTLAAAAAGHSIRRVNELKIAAHVLPSGR